MVGTAEWKTLRDNARMMIDKALRTVFEIPGGCAAITDDGRVVFGCNVENVSYGLTICAEVTLVAQLVATGGGRLRAVAVCDADGSPLMPCGRCRQVLLEHGGPDLLVDHADAPRTSASCCPTRSGRRTWIGSPGDAGHRRGVGHRGQNATAAN